MRELGAGDVKRWVAELHQSGASPTVIRKAKAAMSVMFADAVEAEDLVFNPATGVKLPRQERRKRRQLTARDVLAILGAMPEEWHPLFLLLSQTGLRVSEALGLTWQNVHLGDDPHVLVVEQNYRGERKRLKTDASIGRVPISSGMASLLAAVRPVEAPQTAPVFPSKTGTPLLAQNVRNRVLLPALEGCGLADQGIGFHAFRKACGSLLLEQGKTLKQVQGWLRHSKLSTTLDVYIHQTDSGLGSADVWDEILPAWGNGGATGDRKRRQTTRSRRLPKPLRQGVFREQRRSSASPCLKCRSRSPAPSVRSAGRARGFPADATPPATRASAVRQSASMLAGSARRRP